MSNLRRRATAFLAALALVLGVGTALAVSAPAAHAAVGSIIAPCTPLQDGQFRWYGRTLTECKFIVGLGYYWVVVRNSCSAPATAPADKPAILRC